MKTQKINYKFKILQLIKKSNLELKSENQELIIFSFLIGKKLNHLICQIIIKLIKINSNNNNNKLLLKFKLIVVIIYKNKELKYK